MNIDFQWIARAKQVYLRGEPVDRETLGAQFIDGVR